MGRRSLRLWVMLCVCVVASRGVAGSDRTTNENLLRDRVTAGVGRCLDSRVTLDASSLEAIYLRPQEILKDSDGFCRADKAYWLTSKWHETVGYAFPPFGWKQAIERMAGQDRESLRSVLALVDSLSRGQAAFVGSAVSHICSFLPDNNADLSSTVFLTAAIVPNAFQKDFNVVINATHPDWKKDASTIWNTAVHELAHVGIYRNECFMGEIQPDNGEEYDVYFNLMNEGMATYIAFVAQRLWPADNKDYRLLENAESVAGLLAELNSLVAQAKTLPPDEFRKAMWTIGVQRRALYVAGGHMARTIDNRQGRGALVKTMQQGPRSFVAAYNALVADSLRVYLGALPDTLSTYQQMRQAAVAGDYQSLKRIVALLGDGGTDVPSVQPAHALNTTGRLLLSRNELDLAETVFRLYLKIFPQSENPCLGLGAVHVLKGDYDRAADAYRSLLAVSPANVTALEALDLLEDAPGGSGDSSQTSPRL